MKNYDDEPDAIMRALIVHGCNNKVILRGIINGKEVACSHMMSDEDVKSGAIIGNASGLLDKVTAIELVRRYEPEEFSESDDR